MYIYIYIKRSKYICLFKFTFAVYSAFKYGYIYIKCECYFTRIVQPSYIYKIRRHARQTNIL